MLYRKISSRKGQTESLFKWLFRFCIVLIAGAIMVAILHQYLSEDWGGLHQTEVFTVSAILRNTCLIGDDLQSHTQNIIDPMKVNDENMAQCYKKASLGYSVQLQSISGVTIASGSVLSAEQKANLPLCDVNAASVYKCAERKEYVLYKKGEEIIPGFLVIKVINHVY